MASPTKSPAWLALPWRTRFLVSVLAAATDAPRRKDGTVNRCISGLFDCRAPPTPKPKDGVKTYDVVVDPARNLSFRVFVPVDHGGEDLPVVVFFHGGGFVFLSPAMKVYDALGRRFAKGFPAIVVSVDYRLAPEHRYPAQHDDCFDVLKFLDENGSGSLPENADVSRCFVAGDSAGGNLAHDVARRASEFTFRRLKVIGVVAIQPFLGGIERTASEIELDGTPPLSMKRTDWYWNALMPASEGYDRDNPIINVSGPNAFNISEIDFPATMVVVGGLDIMQDWQKRYYEWLKNSGKEAYLFDYRNMFHGFCVFPDLAESGQLISEVKDFIRKVSNKV